MKKLIYLIILLIGISFINSIKIHAYDYDPPGNDFDNYVWIEFNNCWTDDGVTSGWFERDITITVYGDNTLSNGDVIDYIDTPSGLEYNFPFDYYVQYDMSDVEITAYYIPPEEPEEYINIYCFDCEIDGDYSVSALVGSTIIIKSNYIYGKEFNYFDIGNIYYYYDPLEYVVDKNDASSNGCIYIFTDFVDIDLDPPIFSGPVKITVDLGTTISINEIKAKLTAYDDFSGNVTNRISLYKDNYSNNKYKLGSYNVVFYCSDNSNNISYHNVEICVVDRNPPIFYVSNLFINIEILNSLSQEEIVNLLSGV